MLYVRILIFCMFMGLPVVLQAQLAKVSVVFAAGEFRTMPLTYNDVFSANEVVSLPRSVAGFGLGVEVPVQEISRSWTLGLNAQATFGYMLGQEQFQHFPVSSFKFTRNVVQAPIMLTMNKALFRSKRARNK